jgi:hypothetical protein
MSDQPEQEAQDPVETDRDRTAHSTDQPAESGALEEAQQEKGYGSDEGERGDAV